MLLIIHNLPLNTRYTDVKAMIKDKCGLSELIVDNLVAEGNSKKVTVGLASEGDAAMLVRKINGLYVCNQQLYVEDVRQKKMSEQPYRPGSRSNQYVEKQYNQAPPPQYDNQFYGEQSTIQFQPQPLMAMETSCSPAPNFGVPFYMTAQNQNVGNNLQFMVQYPKVQGSMGNESYKGRDIGFDPQYGGRKRNRSMSPDRGPHRERSPRHLSKWAESDYDRTEGPRQRERQAQRDDDRFDVDQSYKDRSFRNSFQSRSNQDYGSNKHKNSRFDKPSFSLSEPKWERPNRSTFAEQNELNRFNDNRNANIRDRHYNQEREPQRFKENNYSQSRGSDYASRPGDFTKKRPYESCDKHKFSPQNKKFGSNQEFNSRNHEESSGSPFFNNYQNKKNSYLNKSPMRATLQQTRPHMQSKGPYMQTNKLQIHPKGLQKSKPQWQPNNQAMVHPKKQPNFSKTRPAPIEFKKPTEEMLARHEAWRVQASAVIATQIANNVGRMRNKRDPVLIKLKAYVRARIDEVTGDDMSLSLKDMLFGYREKFQDDDDFYNMVLEKVNNSEEDEFEISKKESEEVIYKKKTEVKPKLQFIGKAPAKAPSAGDPQRLPKYPDGDKKVLSQMKQAQKDEMLNESLYKLEADHEKILDEELNKFDELIKQELLNPENEMEKSISKFMKDVFLPDVRKVITLHIKKRILDVRTNLSVRVMCQYKAPKRDSLDAFLKDYGVVSLKASDKNRNVLIAICDSYENYDALCKQESTVIDNLKVTFKPLHLTGPPVKAKFMKPDRNIAKVTTTKSNNGNGGYNDEIISKENDVKLCSNVRDIQAKEDSECEIIASSNNEDVIVIEEKGVTVTDEKGSNVNLDDKVEVLSEDAEVKADSEIITDNNKESIIDKASDKADDINESEIMEHVEPEIIDNDNIADDDLEDF